MPEVDEYYNPGSVRTESENRLKIWFFETFKKRKILYGGAFLLMVGLAWWSDTWFAPVFFFTVFFIVKKVIDWLSKKDYVYILEGRIQGEIITHCAYYDQPIRVPNSWLRLYLLPRARLMTAYQYGDNKMPVNTTNLITCDYYEALPNGDVVIVYPKDSNFSNVGLYNRMTPDGLQAMKKLGEARAVNMDMKPVLMEMYEKGKLGRSPEEALSKLRLALGQIDDAEKAMANSPVALRQVWLYQKNVVPDLIKRSAMQDLMMPQKAMAYAAQLLHVATGNPMAEQQHRELMEVIEAEPQDFDATVRSLVKRGNQVLEAGDVNKTKGNPLDGQARRVLGSGGT